MTQSDEHERVLMERGQRVFDFAQSIAPGDYIVVKEVLVEALAIALVEMSMIDPEHDKPAKQLHDEVCTLLDEREVTHVVKWIDRLHGIR